MGILTGALRSQKIKIKSKDREGSHIITLGQRRIRRHIHDNYNCFRTAFCIKYAKVYSGIGCARHFREQKTMVELGRGAQ